MQLCLFKVITKLKKEIFALKSPLCRHTHAEHSRCEVACWHKTG